MMAIIAIDSAFVNPLFGTSPISLSDSGQDLGFSFIVSLHLHIAIHSDVDDRSNIRDKLNFTLPRRSGSADLVGSNYNFIVLLTCSIHAAYRG